MSFRKASMAALVALSMTSAPALAQASKLSVASTQTSARAGAVMESENELGGGFLIPLLALGAVILGIVVALDDGEDAPTSP